MIVADIVTVSFKWINLSIFFGGAYYLFSTRMLPGIKQRMFAKKNEVARRQAYHKKLQHDLHQIHEHTVQQEVLYKRLLEKVQQWQHHSSQFNKQKEIERERCKQIFENRVTQQYKQVKQEYGLVVVTPIAINVLKNEAVEYFKDDHHVQQYLNQMIEYLEKSA